MSELRIRQELDKIKTTSLLANIGASAGPVKKTNIFEWNAILTGPKKTPYESNIYKSPYIQNQKLIYKYPYYQNKVNKKPNQLFLGESLNHSGVNGRNTLDNIHRNYLNNYLPSSKINNSSLYYKDKNTIRPMMMNISNDYGDIDYNYNSMNNLPNNNYISNFRYNY